MGRYHVLLMECLGPNLQQLMGICGGYFEFKTVAMLLDQVRDELCTPLDNRRNGGGGGWPPPETDRAVARKGAGKI